MATVSELQDMLRSKLGIPDLDPFQLTTFLRWGRHELEVRGNYYYGIDKVDSALVAGTQTYSITSSTAPGLGKTNFKEYHSLFIREVAGQTWIPVPVGAWEGSVDAAHTTQDKPQYAVIHDSMLYVFPVPDAAYPIRLIHFNWTTNPTDITSTDELFTNWEMALFSASMMASKRFLEQSASAGDAWEVLMKDEINKLRDFTNARLRDTINSMSVREAAQVLQASGGQPSA